MTTFQGSEMSRIRTSEPQKGVKNGLFDQTEGTFTIKKNFFKQLLLKRFFTKTLFSGTYSNKLDLWTKIPFSKKSPKRSEKNFCFTICNFCHILSLVNFFLCTLLQRLYLVTQQFFSHFTNALWHRIKKWYYKTLTPMHVLT